MEPVILYGMKVSGHQSRARSYLINAGIPFCERAPSSAHYLKTVVPLAGGISTMPTMEFEDGSVIRDSSAIIDHFESQSGYTFSPTTPKQRFFSRLFDVIGAEGLLRPGMHYRWNFDEENHDFLRFQTIKMLPPGVDVEAVIEFGHGKMRSGTRKFGVNPDTYGVIEAVYADQLAAFDRHFSEYPYLLGGRPCIGDYGLMIMLHPHLGRDPKPLSLMHKSGMNVLRWTERVNQRDTDFTEFEGWDNTYLPNDEIPDTLIDLARVMAEDFVPETLAASNAINTWLEDNSDVPQQTPIERGVGFGKFTLRGQEISALAQPYRFYRLKLAQDEYHAMSAADKAELEALLDRCNMRPVLTATINREIGRKDNLEVWL